LRRDGAIKEKYLLLLPSVVVALYRLGGYPCVPIRCFASFRQATAGASRQGIDQIFAQKAGNETLKGILCAVRLAKKPKNSGTNNNWKTALFLSSPIRGTVFGYQQRHAAAGQELVLTSEWSLS
jgi:hypothetical protein